MKMDSRMLVAFSSLFESAKTGNNRAADPFTIFFSSFFISTLKARTNDPKFRHVVRLACPMLMKRLS